VVFTEAGDGYVMGDGRSYSAHMFANAGGDPAPPNCILRLPAGGTDFASDYHVEASALTGGLETVTELETPAQGTSAAYAWVFDPARLPEGVEPVDFGFWSYPAFQLWQFELGDAPTAAPVDGVPYGVLGFTGSSVDGRLYYGLGDTETSVVYEIDPETGSATEKFTMDGYLYGLAKLAP
jgi:hypothetical protein